MLSFDADRAALYLGADGNDGKLIVDDHDGIERTYLQGGCARCAAVRTGDPLTTLLGTRGRAGIKVTCRQMRSLF